MLSNLDAVLHVARALSEITGRKELVVVGSAAVIAAMVELNGNDFGTEDVDIFSLDVTMRRGSPTRRRISGAIPFFTKPSAITPTALAQEQR